MDAITGKGTQLPGDDINIAGEHVGPNLAIHFSQQPDSNESWILVIRARTEQGDSEIGTIRTRPPARGDPPTRCVAQAFCPGAISWSVQITGPDGAAANVQFTSDKECCVGGIFQGVVTLNGTTIVQTDFVTVIAAGVGVLMPGPGKLFSFYGFTDPAQGLTYIGLVDKATAPAPGDPFMPGTLVQLPALGASFAVAFPRGLICQNGAGFACNAAPGAVVGAIVGAATVHAERG